jgi:hypothetical protein
MGKMKRNKDLKYKKQKWENLGLDTSFLEKTGEEKINQCLKNLTDYFTGTIHRKIMAKKMCKEELENGKYKLRKCENCGCEFALAYSGGDGKYCTKRCKDEANETESKILYGGKEDKPIDLANPYQSCANVTKGKMQIKDDWNETEVEDKTES